METPAGPAPATVRAAASRPGVRAAFDRAHRALGDLRFAEGLRRGWKEARAEAAVREAAALAVLEGARVTVDDLRTHSMRDAGGADFDPATALAVGIWRSQWNMASRFEPLNQRRAGAGRAPVPLPALVASLHRDACSALVASGRLRTGRVAIPVSPAALAAAMARTRIDAPAIARAGAVIAHFRQYEVFSPASAAVGAGLARWILVSNGVDPTGTAVVSAADALDPVAAARALAGWASGDEAGVGEWLVHVAQCVEYGARIGRDIAVHVQARTLGD